MYQGRSVAVRLVALVLLIVVSCLGIIFVLAGMTDVVGSWLAAVAILLVVAAAIAAIVLAAHKGKAAAGTISKIEMLSDWTWSFGMVVGLMAVGFLASFFLTSLLISLAEHGLLPAGFGSTLLGARRASGPESILGLVWVAVQLGWIVPVAVRIYRHGLGQAIEAFRLAGLIGVGVTVPVSFIALAALFFIGPSPS